MKILKYTFCFITFAALTIAFIDLSVRAIEVEQEWRQQRLCEQGYTCEKVGPNG